MQHRFRQPRPSTAGYAFWRALRLSTWSAFDGAYAYAYASFSESLKILRRN